MTPQEMGPYLLLRKLSENALCETYRAGQRSGQEVERVVLLYFFHSDPDDVLWISETAQAGRRALSGLESPSLSAAIDSGEIADSAYLTYDYIPGRGLDVVLEKARALEAAVPIEHALLITDRIAQGLQAAWEHESRALHGFVVPHLVVLSNEGDVQLLGLEVASRLRKLLAGSEVRQQMGRYLAPEVVPEGQPSTTDDVYSLGAILFELLTGQQPPIDTESAGEAIAEARASDGQSLSTPIVDLLETSLVTSFGRSDLRSWRAKLSALLTSGEYDASAFNLALFLHTLFGDEIESEAEEVLGEGTALGVAEPSPTIEPIEPTVPAEPIEPIEKDDEPAVSEESPELLDEIPAALLGEEVTESRGRGRFLAIAAGVVLVAAAGFGAFKLFGPSDVASTATLRSAKPPPLSAPATSEQLDVVLPADEGGQQPLTEQEVAVEEPAPSPEEIDRRVQELLSQRSADMESSLRREFESDLADLRQQLAQAREQAVSRVEEEPAAAADGSIEESATDPAETLRLAFAESFDTEDGVASDQSSDDATVSVGAGGGTEPGSDDASGEDPATIETSDLRGPEPDTGTGTGSAALQMASSSPALEAAGEVAESEPSQASLVEPTPQVQVGDLVAPGPGVELPRIVEPARPVYPLMARRLKKSALVTVRVLVDEHGRVNEAERMGDEAGFGFDAAAVKAALQTRFSPATKDGVPVKIWWTVRIAFQP